MHALRFDVPFAASAGSAANARFNASSTPASVKHCASGIATLVGSAGTEGLRRRIHRDVVEPTTSSRVPTPIAIGLFNHGDTVDLLECRFALHHECDRGRAQRLHAI